MTKINLLFLIFSLWIAACTPKITAKKEGQSTILENVNVSIGHVQEHSWKVGRHFEYNISKQLTVVMKFPAFDPIVLHELKTQYGLNSWLVRVTFVREDVKQELGVISANIVHENVDRYGHDSQQAKGLAFNLTYSAFAISERFRHFHCPAFSHNKKIHEYIISGNETAKTWTIANPIPYTDKVITAELTPTMFNIGETMKGIFVIEVALFNSLSKQIIAPFMIVPQGLIIKNEDSINLKGCEGIHEENH